MRKLPRLGMLLLAGSWCLHAEPARASFHLVMVEEVFPGYASAPNAQFVELQMYAPDQNFVMGQAIQVFDATGGFAGQFAFSSSVSNGADQSTLLIATTQAQTLFGVVPDALMDPVIDPAGGKVCYTGSNDCVAWGNYSGSSVGVGNPVSPAGLPFGKSAQRRLDRGTPGVLDPADDTNDSATDFVLASPTPQNNSGTTRTTPGYGSTPPPSGTISFGSVAVGGTLPATLQINETGGQTLTVSNPHLGGANPGDFSVKTAFPVSVPNGSPPKTVQLSCTPHALGTRTATLTLTTNDAALPTVAYTLTCTGVPGPVASSFFTLAPCRAVDTRTSGGPVVAGMDRTFTIEGRCGVPTTARAVSLNVAVTQPTSAGNIRLFPAGSAVPVVSMLNYSAGQTRANNAVVGLSDNGRLTVHVEPSGSTHVILDLNGYFE
jgi:hypothetical protein